MCAKITIPIRTLDEILRPHPGTIDLSKIDIEGYDVDALLAGTETLSRTTRVLRVLIEFSPNYIRACGRDPKTFLELFGQQRFKLYLICGEMLVPTDSKKLKLLDMQNNFDQSWQIDLIYLKSMQIELN